MNNHSLQNREEEPIAPGSSAAATVAHTHTRGTFHRRPEPLYTEKHKVSCPGFLPKRSPCNIHAAITMRFATSGCKPASLDTHGNAKRQQSCGHYTAICNRRVKKCIESRTHEQPLVAEHRGGTDRARFDRSRIRRAHEVPFIAGRSRFRWKNARFPAPAFSQIEAHATSMQPLQCVLHQRFTKRIESRTHEQPLLAEHRGGTDSARFERSRTRRAHEVPFIAGRSHFIQKSTRILPWLSPKTKPMQHPCNHCNALCNRLKTRIS